MPFTNFSMEQKMINTLRQNFTWSLQSRGLPPETGIPSIHRHPKCLSPYSFLSSSVLSVHYSRRPAIFYHCLLAYFLEFSSRNLPLFWPFSELGASRSQAVSTKCFLRTPFSYPQDKSDAPDFRLDDQLAKICSPTLSSPGISGPVSKYSPSKSFDEQTALPQFWRSAFGIKDPLFCDILHESSRLHEGLLLMLFHLPNFLPGTSSTKYSGMKQACPCCPFPWTVHASVQQSREHLSLVGFQPCPDSG